MIIRRIDTVAKAGRPWERRASVSLRARLGPTAPAKLDWAIEPGFNRAPLAPAHSTRWVNDLAWNDPAGSLDVWPWGP
jgi:hypothetical protein